MPFTYGEKTNIPFYISREDSKGQTLHVVVAEQSSGTILMASFVEAFCLTDRSLQGIGTIWGLSVAAAKYQGKRKKHLRWSDFSLCEKASIYMNGGRDSPSLYFHLLHSFL